MGANKANAYSMFVKETARRRRQSGDTSVNVPNLFQSLDSEWRNLLDRERQRYKDMADRINSTPINSFSDYAPRRDSQPRSLSQTSSSSSSQQLEKLGNSEYCDNMKPNLASLAPDLKPDIKPSLAVVAKRPYEQDLFKPNPNPEKKYKPGIPNWKNIKNKNIEEPRKYFDEHLLKLRLTCESIARSRINNLTTMPMHAISVNVLCKQNKGDLAIFVPIEISIYTYTLRDGRGGKPYHVLIDAGPIPTGCVNAAADHAMKHKITIPPRGYPSEARNDYKKIYKEMLDYTTAGERTVLIADYRDYNQVRKSLEWLHLKATEGETGRVLPGIGTWTVLPIIEFVGTMHSYITVELLKHPMPHFALNYLIKTVMENCVETDYNDAYMCDYHRKEENQTKFCTLSCAARTFLNIEIILEDVHNKYMISRRPTTPPPAPQDPRIPVIHAGPLPSISQPPPSIAPADPRVARHQQIVPENQPLAIEAAPEQ